MLHSQLSTMIHCLNCSYCNNKNIFYNFTVSSWSYNSKNFKVGTTATFCRVPLFSEWRKLEMSIMPIIIAHPSIWRKQDICLLYGSFY